MSGTLAFIAYDYELEEMERDLPLCTMEEFTQRLKNRDDIFVVNKDKILRNIQTICIALAIASGIWLSHQTYLKVNPTEAVSFVQKLNNGREVNIKTIELDRNEVLPKPKEIVKPAQLTMRKKTNKVNVSGTKNRNKGGGDPRSRKVNSMGVLGILSGEVEGKQIAYSDPLAKGGFAKKLDAVFAGVEGLSVGTNSGTGRKGEVGIGFGPGAGSGFDEGTGGVGDIFDNLVDPEIGNLKLKTNPKIVVSAPITSDPRSLIGGRSRASIMRVVNQNLQSLRYAYSKRLREIPGLKGKVKIKFAVDEYGKVLFCEVVNSSMGDERLEKVLVSKIKRWMFEKINKPGDVTEIIYPFVFSI